MSYPTRIYPIVPTRWLLYLSLIILGFLLMLPAAALADGPEPAYEGPEKCAECHADETAAWQNSPHARAITAIDPAQLSACQKNPAAEGCNCLECHTTAFNATEHTYTHTGVTCESCHGPYVEDHPSKGVMQLTIDSSGCKDCHTDTHQQWEASPHGQAGVQCIGCHLSHSQEFRLTDEKLCRSCHQDEFQDFSHTAHKTEGITCTDCHLSAVPAESSNGQPVAPSHSFSFASHACVNCHEQDSTQAALQTVSLSNQNDLRTQAMGISDCPPKVISQLKATEEHNDFLQTLSVTGLGLGVGIGGMMGVVAMVVVGYVYQGRKSNNG